MRKGDLHFSLIGKPKVILTSTSLDEMPAKIRILLGDFVDVIVDELPNALPPVISISHCIDLIPGASLHNKAVDRLTPQEMKKSNNRCESYWTKGW
jgi:hypothetical protein